MSLLITDLPQEVIAHIFDFVGHKMDRHRLALACKKFHRIIRQQSRKHQVLQAHNSRIDAAFKTFLNCDPFPFKKLALWIDNNTTNSEPCAQWAKNPNPGAAPQNNLDVCVEAGPAIEMLEIYCAFNEEFFLKTHNKLVEVFPNLKTLEVHPTSGIEIPVSVIADGKAFSSLLEELKIFWMIPSFVPLEHYLRLFPGLKRLHLEILPDSLPKKVDELRSLLDKWLSKLEKIEIDLACEYSIELVQALVDLNTEKLNFDGVLLRFNRKYLEALKSFYGQPRSIQTLKLIKEEIDEKLLKLIERNTKIDLLHIFQSTNFKQLEGLLNSKNVKEIAIWQDAESMAQVNFTPDALLKVKELNVHSRQNFAFPAFRQLKSLDIVVYCIAKRRELKFIVDTCPLLEQLSIMKFYVSYSGEDGDSVTEQDSEERVYPSFSNLKQLRSLGLSNAPYFCDDFLLNGCNLPKLKILQIGGIRKTVTSVGIESLAKNCPNLEMINIKDCNEDTYERVSHLTNDMPYLKRLLIH